MHVRAFWLAKRGNTAAEYEDAFAVDAAGGRFAVADGATESSFAGEWARLLVEAFVQSPAPRPEHWAAWLPPLQGRWAAAVGGRPLPWYAEAKLQLGAFATFLGLVLEKPGRKGLRRWSAIAVGDSCLFQMHRGDLRRAFPFGRAEEFGNSPWLIGSRASPAALKFQTGKGRLYPGDRLCLMTDALAHWFLTRREAGRKPWASLEPLLAADDGPEPFAAWVEELRERDGLRNDDVTLVVMDG